ncbi:cation-transporting P-type ATPase, partial [Candidatus Bathyarchaeota archaeon]
MRENHTETEECCDVCNIESLEGEGGEKGKEIILISLSAILLSVGLIFEFILEWRMPAEILFLATAAISGYSIAKEGFSSLIFRRKLSINFLIMIAAAGSFFIGHGEEGAAVIFLFYVAEYLESYAGERARKSIASLMELAPEVAAVKRNGKEVKVPVSEVDVNEVIVIRPGEKIPLDGEVIRGVSTVNQTPITGESAPVTKEIGDVVYAGTINNEGFLEVKVTKRSDETMLS